MAKAILCSFLDKIRYYRYRWVSSTAASKAIWHMLRWASAKSQSHWSVARLAWTAQMEPANTP